MRRVPVREGLFTLGDDPSTSRLLASRCDGCDGCAFPVQEVCPYCGGEATKTLELSQFGTLEVCTTVVNRPPGYDGTMPFGFGVVELAEGIRIISRIRDPGVAGPGTRVRLVLETIGSDENADEIVTYAFTPQT